MSTARQQEHGAGRVIASASMSLDGYIAKHDNTIGYLFDWLHNGDLAMPTASPGITFRLNRASYDYWTEWVASVGALVCGRTLFDVAEGWGGRHTMDVPVVVLTHTVPTDWVTAHPDAPFTFITGGVDAAVERARVLADGRNIAITAGTVATQCLEAGLLDEVAVDLVPVLMGGGRPYFVQNAIGDVPLEDPTTCIRSSRVTHLRFPVKR